MRKIPLILFLLCVAIGVRAQTFNEVFRQQKTQKKYLTQQIAALQVAIDYTRKGYSIAREGLGTVGNFKAGELGLHREYFNSLRNVTPSINKIAKITDIMVLQTEIVEQVNKTYRWVELSEVFHGDEEDYVKRVFERLLDDCEGLLDELLAVTMDGELEMKDNERLERIDLLYWEMMEKFTFFQGFSKEAEILAVFRIKETGGVEMGRMLYGIKKD